MRHISPPEGQITRKKILGRGNSSGKGRTSTKGHKGRKARAGGTVLLGFEGGQMKLVMRMPKVGFSNSRHQAIEKALNLHDLEAAYVAGEEVSLETLRAKGLARKKHEAVKILGEGKLTKSLKIASGIRVSAKAKEALTAAGATFA